LLKVEQSLGWWFIVAGLLLLIIGALALSLTFEWFTRNVVRWIGLEEEFSHD